MSIKLVVGLGNPGRSYQSTRHNIGRRVLEHFENPPAGVFLLEPETFMNSSGLPVAEMARRNGFEPNQILVVLDDFELPLGVLRFRTGGSSGGHNGLRSILETLGTTELPRLRIGIGPVPEGEDPAEFVLQPFRSEEKKKVEAILPKAADAVRRALEAGMETAMNEYNNREL